VMDYRRAVFVMIDVDNFYHALEPRRLAGDLTTDLRCMVEEECGVAVPERVAVRLYGGWMVNGVLTQTASQVLSAVALARVFPLFCTNRAGTVIRGDIRLANELLCLPEISWQHTCTTRQGAPRLRMNGRRKPSGCYEDPATCFVAKVEKFTRSLGSVCPVPGCNVTNREAFQRLQQKMVDTLMVCDLLHLAAISDSENAVIVASDDWDVLPSLAAAAHGGLRTSWIRRNSTREQYYDRMLVKLGVRIENWGWEREC